VSGPRPTQWPKYLVYATAHGVRLHQKPWSSSPITGVAPDQSMVHIGCFTTGQQVSAPWANNDPRWDWVAYGGKQGFATDVFIKTGTDVRDPSRIPKC